MLGQRTGLTPGAARTADGPEPHGQPSNGRFSLPPRLSLAGATLF